MAKTVKVEIDAASGSLCVSEGAFFLGEKAPIQFTGFTLDEGHSLRLTVFDRDRTTPLADNTDSASVLDLRYEGLRKAFHGEQGAHSFYAVVNELDEDAEFLEHVLAAGMVQIMWSPEVFDEISGYPATMRGATGATGATGRAFTFGDLTPEQKAELKGERGETGANGAQGAQGPTGPEGPQGHQGVQGVRGIQGVAGEAATVTVVSTVTLPAGSSALVENVGSTSEAELKFSIPQGAKGDTGNPGPANALSIGTVIGGATAGATITGTSPNQTLNLVLPKGDKGDDGEAGPQGDGSYIYDSADQKWHNVTVYTDPVTGEKTTSVSDEGISVRPSVDSPTATVTQTGTGATITTTDATHGTRTATVTNGTNGTDGITPHVGANGNWFIGTTDTDVLARGTNGEDGHSPVLTQSKQGKTTTIYKDGVSFATIQDGIDGTGSVSGATMNGSPVTLDENGVLQLGTVLTDASDFAAARHAHEDKADKVSRPTSGNFAGLDANGNLTDSGKKASDFDVSGAAAGAVSEHNSDSGAHNSLFAPIASHIGTTNIHVPIQVVSSSSQATQSGVIYFITGS